MSKKYDIRCVEADGSDYRCETFATKAEAENALKQYKDEPLYEHYYVAPSGLEDIPEAPDEPVKHEKLTEAQLDAYFDGLKHIYEDY